MANTRYANQRVGIFIDVQNLYHSARNMYRGRVNYAELMKNLVDGRELIRAIAYVVKSEGTPAEVSRSEGTRSLSTEASFFEALEKAGLELRMKDLQMWADGTKKADWDVGMAVDAIRMADSLDVVVLVTGDGDFIPLVEFLKWGKGVYVEVAAFGKSASSKLHESADKFTNIETIPKSIIRK
jgi:uncharacterized LabA/DUF88 family protein